LELLFICLDTASSEMKRVEFQLVLEMNKPMFGGRNNCLYLGQEYNYMSSMSINFILTVHQIYK